MSRIMPSTRRRFLAASAAFATAAWPLRHTLKAADASPRTYRAAIIGHTGAGDYGHGYDRIFQGLDQVSVTAVADPNLEGGRQAAERCGAPRVYADYREMLRKEKPDLVSIALRHPRPHKDIALAAVEVARGLFMEKPMTESVADADEILSAAAKRDVQIVVAHGRRYDPEFVRVRRLLAQGFAGRVREVRIQGKQDARAGGEDLIVLGTHDFDLMRFYFGDPRWCSAVVTEGGREVTARDAREGREPILVAGDTIHAQFAFPANVHVTWSSVKTDDGWNAPPRSRENWAFEILGTRRVIAYQSGSNLRYLDSPYFLPSGESAIWRPLPEPTGPPAPDHQKNMARDLIHAIETGSPPLCGGQDGRWAIEMVAAIYLSHLSRARATFPLANRRNPLA